jgi:hypothetical protein
VAAVSRTRQRESMTALAASEQETHTSRNRLLWEEEIRAIRTSAQSLSPAARRTVRAVLETILHESDDEIAASARSLLDHLHRLEGERGEVKADRWPRNCVRRKGAMPAVVPDGTAGLVDGRFQHGR